mmetsp:Transcript_1279/g.2431  ORF Transcript_1279/g.2431 Transcript_1279/m.2431 type:complete len:174 (+) Transcript_1279:1093-1614(+)
MSYKCPRQRRWLLSTRPKKAGRLGTLFWCDPRKKRKPPADCGRLEVEDLASISLGKQTRILQTAAATMAEAEACLSLIGPSGQISLEMEEGELEVDTVIKAVEHIIKASKDKTFIKETDGHGKFQKVSYQVHKLAEVYKRKMNDEDDEEGDRPSVDVNWQVPLGFEGGAYAGG